MVNNTESETRFDSSKLHTRSFNLGMIYAFVEVVASGCKRLALSPTLTQRQLEEIWEDVNLIAKEYSVVLYIDEDFMTTRLFNPEYTRGKLVIHLAAKQETIDEYRLLREKKNKHRIDGTLDEKVEQELAWGLGRLLSYSDDAIKGLLEKPRF